MRESRYRSSSEQRIVEPIVIGYLGMIAHLNGRTQNALDYYKCAINKLEQTEQLRATAIFILRRGNLYTKAGDEKNGLSDIRSAIRYAEACGQLDILWRARVAESSFISDLGARDKVTRAALHYANRAGVHRVSIEAYMANTATSIESKNYEQAADLAGKAMIIANTNGMTMRKISLRITMGRIMLLQGDKNGLWLINNAIKDADEIGYQAAVKYGNNALLSSIQV